MKKGFTLIELLVVIAIIGLLSSMVLVSIKGTTQEAEKKRAMQLSSSLQHSLTLYALGMWSFDDNLKDSSDNGNDGQPVGTGITYVDGIMGKAVKLDGTGYVSIPLTESLRNKSGAFTMEFWAKVDNVSDYMFFVANFHPVAASMAYTCYHNATNLVCSILIDPMEGSASFTVNSAVKVNQWFHVVLTYDGKTASSAKLYFNGKAYNPTTNTLTGPFQTNQVNIGASRFGSNLLKGSIEGVRIYDSYMTLSEVEKHYTEGLKEFVLK